MISFQKFVCESCNVPLSLGSRSPNKKFCDKCLNERRTQRNILRAKRWKHINLNEKEIEYLNKNNISLSKLIHHVLRERMSN